MRGKCVRSLLHSTACLQVTCEGLASVFSLHLIRFDQQQSPVYAVYPQKNIKIP